MYRLCLRDKFGVAVDDPSRSYVLSIRKPQPDFQVVATPMSAAPTDAAVWCPILRKNGVAPIRINVLRQDGQSGDVAVEAQGLPKGVSCNPLTIGGTDSSGLLVLSAGDGMENWSGTLKIVAKGTVNDAEVTREAMGGAVVWGSTGDGKNGNNQTNLDVITSRLTRDFAVGVCVDEVEPMTITPAEDKVYEVQAGTKISIPLKVKKSSEPKQPLKLKPVGIDGLRGGRDLTVDPKADTASFDLDLNQMRLAPGTYTVCLSSLAQMKVPRAGEQAPSDDKAKGAKKKDDKETSLTVYSAPITFKVLPSAKKGK
jgi:hypothetical protein